MQLKELGEYVDIEKIGNDLSLKISEKIFFVEQMKKKDTELKDLSDSVDIEGTGKKIEDHIKKLEKDS